MFNDEMMKNIRLTLVFVTLLFLIGCDDAATLQENDNQEKQTAAAQLSAQKTEQVSVRAFKELINRGESIVLDVRTADEMRQKRIVDAPVSIDFYNDDFAQEIAKLDRSKTYLLHCKAGSRSSQALTLMQDLGFERVYELQGGIAAWEGAGYVLVQ